MLLVQMFLHPMPWFRSFPAGRIFNRSLYHILKSTDGPWQPQISRRVTDVTMVSLKTPAQSDLYFTIIYIIILVFLASAR